LKYKNFDIIGDIHGHADALSHLLKKMGYKKHQGVYTHKSHQAIFLGDFIDKGNQQAKVINIVKAMVEHGTALAVMGNHEFNAICYHSRHSKSGQPLREHSEHNIRQHQQFLKEYPLGNKQTEIVIQWFKSLPVFIEMEPFRLVHACLDREQIETIKPWLNSDNTLTEQIISKACQKNSMAFNAIETLLKGLEIPLPEGNSFLDPHGNQRSRIRIKWWQKHAQSYQDYALLYKEALPCISTDKIPKHEIVTPYTDKKPVFFGHYWFSGTPKQLANNAVCLDYSIAHKGKLACYRWYKDDKKLSDNQFIWVDEQ